MKRSALLLPIVVVLTPAIALAAPRTFSELAGLIVNILDGAAGLLVLAGIVVYFYGLSTNILKMKDEGGEKFRSYFIWGIIVIFIMVSIWGILRILQNTLFGSNAYSPTVTNDRATPTFDAPQFID